MIRAHMTKTHKISLLVTLLLAFVALVSAAFILPKSANAEDDQTVGDFVNYMTYYVEMDKSLGETSDKIEREDFFKKTGESYDHFDHWMNYFSAKSLYISVMDTSQKEEAAKSGAAWTVYEQLDAFLSADYDLYIKDLELYDVANAAEGEYSYSANGKVTALESLKNALVNADEQALLAKVTEGWTNFTAAKAKMVALRAKLDEVQTTIAAIRYYDKSAQEMKTVGFTASNENAVIVLGSEDSIKTAETALKPYIATETEYINNYKDYQKAVADLAAQKQKAADLATDVNDIHVENGKIYYSVKEEIEAVEAAYTALGEGDNKVEVAGKNENDLRVYFQTEYATEYAKIQTMRAYLDALQTKITEAITKVAAVKAAKEGGTAKYTSEYNQVLTDARSAFDALDQDIKDHDTKKYAGTDYQDKPYIVTDYNILVEAEEEYAQWNRDVADLEEEAKAVFQAYVNITQQTKPEAVAEINRRAISVNTKYMGLKSDEQKAKFRNDKVTAQDVTVPEGAAWTPVGTGYYTALQYIIKQISDAYTQVQDINTQIYNLYAGGDYDYSVRNKIKELWKLYEGTYADTDLAAYISNYSKLKEMIDDVDAADKLVEAWLAAVAEIETTGSDVKTVAPVTVDNWEAVKAARTAYQAIDQGDYKGAKFNSGNLTPSKVVANINNYSDANTDTAEKTKWADNYTLYSTAATQLETLEKAFDNEQEPQGLKQRMAAIECDADLAIGEQMHQWITALHEITAAYNALLKVNGDAQSNFEENQDYFERTYATEFANYGLALTYEARYNAEDKINVAWQQIGGNAEDTDASNPNAKVTLAKESYINEAKTAYDKYVTAYGEDAAQADIRNVKQLEKMWKDLQDITKALNTWIISVIQLADRSYEAPADVTKIQLLAKIEELSEPWDRATQTGGFRGYPLDISAEGDYAKLGTQYTNELTKTEGAADAEKTRYLEEAHVFYELLRTRSDDITERYLDAEIAKLQGKDTFTDAEMKTIEEMIKTYNALDESQQAEVNWSAFSVAVNSNQMMHAFIKMVDNLAANVEGNNYTSFTQYYINAAKAIYATLGVAQTYDDVKAAYAKLDKVEEDYTAYIAENEDKVVDLNGLKAELDRLAKTVGDNNTTLTNAIAELQSTIDKINSTIEGINGDIEDLEGKLATAQATIEKLTKDLEALQAKEGAFETSIQKTVADLKAELEGRIDALEDFQTSATTDINGAKSNIEALQKALGDIENIQAAINAMGEKVSADTEKEINDLKTEISGKIAALEQKINELTQADSDMQGQIDSLQTDVTALMAVLIVVAVITAGLAVCVVLLFLKRKK